MRSVIVEKPVHDMNRLLEALRSSDPPFSVIAIGVDERRTYVYLNDKEEKDPTPVVQAWKDEAYLRLTTSQEVAPDGIPEALTGAIERFAILIEKVSHETQEVLPGDEEMQIRIKTPEGSSCEKKRLVKGKLSLSIGPSKTQGDVQVSAIDRKIRLGSAELKARFVDLRTPPAPPEIAPPEVNEVQELEEDAGFNEVEAAIQADLGVVLPSTPPAPPQAPVSFWTKLFSKWKKP